MLRYTPILPLMKRYFIPIFLALLPFSLQAAQLYLTPSSGQLKIGREFTVEIKVKSEEPVNAFGITLFYSPETLEFVKSGEKNSLINLWIQKPKAEKSEGEITLLGGKIGGFEGDGVLTKLVFKVKASGKATLKLSESSLVLKHDGYGTPAIISNLGRLDIITGRY